MVHTNKTPLRELLTCLRLGDDSAALVVHRRYARRLMGMASKRLETGLSVRLDIEGIVQSACKSFFLRHRAKPFELADWEDIWIVLAMITRRKCLKRLRFERARRRFFGREVPLEADSVFREELSDREPAAYEVVAAREIQDRLLAAMDADDRAIVAMFLEGHTAEDSAERLGCSVRTVGRVRRRAKAKLLALMGE